MVTTAMCRRFMLLTLCLRHDRTALRALVVVAGALLRPSVDPNPDGGRVHEPGGLTLVPLPRYSGRGAVELKSRNIRQQYPVQ